MANNIYKDLVDLALSLNETSQAMTALVSTETIKLKSSIEHANGRAAAYKHAAEQIAAILKNHNIKVDLTLPQTNVAKPDQPGNRERNTSW